MAQFVYVSIQDDDKILIFELDFTTGGLALQSEVSAAGGPSALTGPRGRILSRQRRGGSELHLLNGEAREG